MKPGKDHSEMSAVLREEGDCWGGSLGDTPHSPKNSPNSPPLPTCFSTLPRFLSQCEIKMVAIFRFLGFIFLRVIWSKRQDLFTKGKTGFQYLKNTFSSLSQIIATGYRRMNTHTADAWKCLDTRLPGTVFKKLDTRKSEILTSFLGIVRLIPLRT